MSKVRPLTSIALASATLAFSLFAGAEPVTLGYEYDITRDKTPTQETLRRVVDIVSSLGYTQLHLYFKDNFAYPGHELVWGGRAHLTAGEARELDAYCRGKGVELVPYHVSADFLAAAGRRYGYDFEGTLTGDKSVSVVFDNGKIGRICPEMKTHVPFHRGVRRVLSYVLSHPEEYKEDPEFDAWCDRVIDVLERAKKEV